jgi:VanZ family protein
MQQPAGIEPLPGSGWLAPVDGLLRWWLRQPLSLRALLVVALAGMLWWSSSQPPGQRAPNMLRSLLHNGAHIVAYAAVGGACWCALWHAAGSPRRRATVAMLLAIGYGAIDELHQGQVAGRVCSVVDWLTDLCGAGLAITWLRWRFGEGPALGRSALPWWMVAAIGSACLATFGPW